MIRGRTISPGHELAMALRTAYLGMHRQADVWFLNAGVTADQFVLMSAVSEGGAATQQELADRIDTDANTLRGMLILLEKKALIRREPHPTDRRARVVRLTPLGDETRARLWEKSEPYRQRLTERLGPEDSRVLTDLLRRFARAMSPGKET